MIYSKVIKILPSMNHYVRYTENVAEFNRLMFAFRKFFDSATLTKDDYQHIANVLTSKLPILETSNDMTKYIEVVLAYVKHDYVPNPDFDKVIPAFLRGVEGLRPKLLRDCFYIFKKKLPDLSDFVGIEAMKGFHETPVNQKDYDFIMSINKISH